MNKNYNYNYVNRQTAQKSTVEFSNVELYSCTSAVLKKSAVSNGRIWHTTDTNEFFYDWAGKRNKLNVTGDSSAITAELNKLKKQIADLSPENVARLETTVNNAVATINNLKTTVNNAVTKANNAAQTAQNAAAQVAGKVDASDLATVATSGKYNDLTGKPDLTKYAKKTDLPTKVSDLTNDAGYLTEHQSLTAYAKKTDLNSYAKKTDIPDVSDFATKSEIPDVSNFASKSEIPDVSNFATKSEIPDVSGKADKSELPSRVSDLTNDSGYLTANDLPDFLTDSDIEDFAKKSDVPTNISDLTNDAGYITSTNLRIPAEWNINDSMRDLIDDINDDTTATPGKVYLGTIHLNDLPYSEDESWSGRRLVQGEARIEIMASQGDTGKVINFTLTSTLKPYHWEYTSSWRNEGEWISFLTEHQDISDKANRSDIPTNVSDLNNDAGYITANDLPDYLTDSDLPDITAGSFPAGDEHIEDATADADGIATVQDVMDYVRAYFEKKKDELGPDGSDVPVAIPYLYTNGYRPGDTPIELTDPLNSYEIVLDGNGEFVIELVHKNEEGGWFEIEGDPDANYYGDFFKVIIPSDYEVKTYRWDNDNSDYTIDAETDMPACNLVEGSSTPDNVTYYYKDAVDGYLFNGAKTAVEDEIALYNNHWLKLVVTKK